MFKRGGSNPRSNPLPFKSFIYHFWQKGYPFRTPSIDKWYPFHPLPNLELYIIITTINTLSCKYNWTFLQRPPWGKKETGHCREVETKVKVWTARQKKKGRCRAGADLGGGCRGCAPLPEMTCGFLIQLAFCPKKKKLCGLLVLK